MLPLLRVYPAINSSNGMLCQIFHLRCNILIEIDLLVRVAIIKVLLKSIKGHFVALFEFAKVIPMFLYCVICQMDIFAI